jgi:DNA-binding IclR family transcriptional regulator
VTAQTACSEPFNVTREELAAATGIDATEVAHALDALVCRGCVERVSKDCYRLVMPE